MAVEQTQELVAQIRRARKARGWSQAKLAEEAGLAPNTVMRLESGGLVRPGSLTAAMSALGIEHLSQVEIATDALPSSVQLVLEITERWITSLPADQIDGAARDLTRWIMSRMTGS